MAADRVKVAKDKAKLTDKVKAARAKDRFTDKVKAAKAKDRFTDRVKAAKDVDRAKVADRAKGKTARSGAKTNSAPTPILQ